MKLKTLSTVLLALMLVVTVMFAFVSCEADKPSGNDETTAGEAADETTASESQTDADTSDDNNETTAEETTGGETKDPAVVLADVPADRYDATVTPRTGNNESTPLVISSLTLDGKFSPFFYTSAYDGDIVGMTQISLLASDRDGSPVAGIDEASYAYSYTTEIKNEGTADEYSEYTFILKNGLTFSDGTPITVKDLLFSIYVLSDPLYDGSSTFYSMDIKGMNEYRTQTTAEVNAKYSALADKIFAAGINEDGTYPTIDGVTAEQQEAYWSYLDAAGSKFAQEIVDYVYSEYSTYVEAYFAPYTLSDLAASDSLKVAYGMVMWGFGALDENKVLTDALGNTYDLTKDTLTADIYWENILGSYGYNFSESDGINAESAGTLIEDLLKPIYILNEGGKEVEGGISFITGITYGTTVCEDGVEREYIKMEIDGVDPTAIFKLGVAVAPFHYYTDGYTGELNEFGVALNTPEFMSHLKTKNSAPLGAGPYIFVEYKDNVVSYVANDSYLLGSPKIKNLRYQVITQGSELDALKTGTVHYSDPSATPQIVSDITAGTGDYAKLNYTLVDNDGYGYIGIQGQYFSDINVRKAIVHALDVDLIIADYYGELASANYRTMTKVQWAYPDNPEKIYPYDGTGATSKDLLIAAGYIYDEAANIMYYPADHEKAGEQFVIKFTLPSDAKDHPAGCLGLDFQKVMAKIGVKVDIEIDENVLNKLNTAYDSGIQMWAAAWGNGGVDPDLFQIWYSDPNVNQASSPMASGIYWLYEHGSDDQKQMLTELNELIIAGRSTLDQEERKEIYKRALEITTGLAVEVPTYQRKNLYAYNKEVIKADTLLSGEDVTPFQSPLTDIHLVELN